MTGEAAHIDTSEAARARLGRIIAAALGEATVLSIEKLSGGAIQENYAVDVETASGRQRLVLRADAPSAIAVSHGRAQEFALLKVAHAEGMTVPQPIFFCADPTILGKPFYVMRRVAGTAAGHVIVRDDKWHGDRIALADRLGRELAILHRVRPPHPDLAFLPMPSVSPALVAIEAYRGFLDSYRLPRPALEWGLRWLERHAPPLAELVLCHRDYRTGNYMVDDSGLTGILDWEFAGWGDPHEDIGWFCAKCWRFGANAREAGGIAGRDDFLRGYSAESGRRIDPGQVRYWETMAHARWAVIALQQGERHVSGAEPSLDLALTGRRVAELEYELLLMTGP
ncbi:MAG: aminoglycoside phosphotransferase [Rhodospirillales bacterium]|nr:aminoglycoside phosphotransferase [Rhodospirillales bacterium]